MQDLQVRRNSGQLVCAGALLFGLGVSACATGQTERGALQPPRIIPHTAWESSPSLGYAADATRRNIRAGDNLVFRELNVSVLATETDTTRPTLTDHVRLRLTRGTAVEERRVRERAAFNWQGYHVAVVAIPNPGELGAGLVSLEIATLASLPSNVANADSAGGAAMRLRVPHEITHVTLHHTGSAEPLRPEEDAREKLRGLQSWGASDRNWWDVPYHYLIDLEGRIYEGRDHRFMGETNTTYDPRGHFLISVIGNYERQPATPAQLETIADLMAWAITRYNVPLDRLGGHYNYAQTSCPGVELRKYLEDGTFRRMVQQRIDASR